MLLGKELELVLDGSVDHPNEADIPAKQEHHETLSLLGMESG